ncbi:4Fe-4S binding protein [bacterium]|nr:4Fe-4S binding protein [bacterium]
MTQTSKTQNLPTPNNHPRITIFSDWCKSCGICVAFCPKEVLAMTADHEVLVKAPEKCIACHMCELRCPDFAINVEEHATGPDSQKGELQ